jgi:hypothetical protein
MLKFVSHSATVLEIAIAYGWLPGARYTNLRDVRRFERLGFLDIVWDRYDFRYHYEIAKHTRPLMTIAQDVIDRQYLGRILDQAYLLKEYCKYVAIVPKDTSLEGRLDTAIPRDFILGYSVPTRYGGTPLSPRSFQRSVHLLGGRPDIQRRLANRMPVLSIDANRFTLDAAFGDYFDGITFRPHPTGGYKTCLTDSIINITALWSDYERPI